jgi:two-component system, chemotaxis family, protein-glutamate methylesterase/glutaminase
MSTRVLIVDDSPLSQRWLREVIAADPSFSVTGMAANGLEALDLAQALRPDLLTLDLSMPVMDGVTTLKHLMASRPVRTVVVSQFAADDSHLTFDCLRYGAVDFITKPSGIEGSSKAAKQREALACLRRAARISPARLRLQRTKRRPVPSTPGPSEPAKRLLLVLAGRSGIAALLDLLAAAPRSPDLVVAAYLDLPAFVVSSLATYLEPFCALERGATGGHTALNGGAVYLASLAEPVLWVSDQGRSLTPLRPPLGASRESVLAAVFTSAAETFGRLTRVALLSGTPPGTAGLLGGVVAAGGTVAVQAPDTALDGAALVEVIEQHVGSSLPRWDSLFDAAGARTDTGHQEAR